MIGAPPGGAVMTQLQWLVQAPPLIPASPWEDAGSWLLREWQRDPALPSRAAHFLMGQPQPSRIGLQFENQVAALVEHSSGLELVARNLPIRDEQRTLGELDLLVRDLDTGKLWHWELALKFYLGTPDQWYGPNRRDTLARKIAHLHGEQLPRSQSSQASRTLSETGWKVDGQALLTRGRLFYRSGHPEQPLRHPRHERGWWLPARGLPSQQWHTIPRTFWSCPSMSDKSTNTIDTRSLIDYVEEHSRPVMVLSALRPEPGFIVPVTWPNT
ncbi:DUF1853 family protein [Alcanivorax profundi]|uniref:DUF1853 family protein n=1 Tax=Alcanivorax profundi TaxID=2338368 RepID=A0A418Y1J2_9GAMM|nr:DUF1853 family protein [Alcanivorax profundi]RJG19406.1 DUF1853 family protein [Alcanivorax profundi]